MLRRYGATELVTPQIKLLQLTQLAKFGRNRPVDFVTPKIKDLQLTLLAKFGRHRANQLVLAKPKPSHPIITTDHPIPTAFRPRLTQPTV